MSTSLLIYPYTSRPKCPRCQKDLKSLNEKLWSCSRCYIAYSITHRLGGWVYRPEDEFVRLRYLESKLEALPNIKGDKMKKNLKEAIRDYLDTAMLIAAGVFLAYIFISIAITGGYRAYEPNTAVLVTEILMSFFFIGFGIFKLIEKLNK